MLNINNILKTIVTIILVFIIIELKSYMAFWVLAVYLLILSIMDKNFWSMLFDAMIIIILIIGKFNDIAIYIYKILMIISLLILYFSSFSIQDKIKFNYLNKKKRKKYFYKNRCNMVNDYNEDKAYSVYKSYDLKAKNKEDLDDLYETANRRFYGYKVTYNNIFKKDVKVKNLIYLILNIILFFLLAVYW